MAEGRNILRDLTVRLGVVKDADAEQKFANFGKALKAVGRFAAIAVIDLAAYNLALSVASAKLGDRTWAWNIQRTANLARTLAGGVHLATTAYERFASGLGLVNAELVEHARMTVRNAELLRMSTRDYQSVAYAFEEFGLTEQDMSSVLQRFGANAGEALDKVKGPVSVARAEFAKLGISVKDLEGRNPLEVMELTAEKLKSAPNQRKAIEAVYRLLGEDAGGGFADGLAHRLLPALQQGAGGITRIRRQALNQGLIIDDKLLQNGAELAEQFSVLARMIDTFWRSVGLRLAPAVQILVEAWQDLIVANRGWIETRIQQAIDVLTFAVRRFDGAIRAVDWELLFSIWAGWGLFQQGVNTTLSLASHLFLLGSALSILVRLLPLVATGVRWVWVQFGLLFPATQAAVIAMWEWVASAVAATAAALGLATATGFILVVLAALAALVALLAIAIPFFLALWVVIEDLVTWWKGGVSVFGAFLDLLKEALPWLDEWLGTYKSFGNLGLSVLKLMAVLVREITEGIVRSLGPALGRLLLAFARLMGFESLEDVYRAIAGTFDDWADAVDRLAASLENLDQWVTKVMNGLGSLGLFTAANFSTALPGPGGVAGSVALRGLQYGMFGNGSQSTTTQTVNQNITVNGTDRAAGRQLGDEALRGAREALEGTTR